MTDRELLELAAKSAGMAGGYVEHFLEVGIARSHTGIWNPLEDDGDALRLAVKLQLGVAVYNDRVDTTDGENVDLYEYIDYDPYAATRRAIVRAAAEIGKAMP